MKLFLTHSAISLTLALSLATPAALAKPRKKYSAAHYAAIKKCRAYYKTAVKYANTKKGKEKRDMLDFAKRAEKDCEASAPK